MGTGMGFSGTIGWFGERSNLNRGVLCVFIVSVFLAKAETEITPSQTKVKPAASRTVFAKPAARPAYLKLQLAIAQAFRIENYSLAKQLTAKALELSPFDPGDHYNHACALAQLGEIEKSLDSLQDSVRLGFHGADHMRKDPDLKSLRPGNRFYAITENARMLASKPPGEPPWLDQVTLAPVSKGIATVTEASVHWDFRSGLFHSYVDFPKKPSGNKVATGFSLHRWRLRSWYDAGTAAGHHGDLYDNFDKDHSQLNCYQFPQLTRLEYDGEARARNLTSGLQNRFVHHGAVVFGNSSTAEVATAFWRSQPRNAYTRPGGAALLHAQYNSNQLYFYPEHRDHDPGHNGKGGGFGDTYPANTPYVIISQGSSGSDQPFLETVACILAAFPPEVKEKLKESGGLMAAVQAVFRQGSRKVDDKDDYLSGGAHPTVFVAEDLDVGRMIGLAHDLELEKLPPRVRIKMVEEDPDPPTYGTEKLFDTPQAIARVFRTLGKERRMVLSAEDSTDPQGGSLEFHWKVLRGDPGKIRVRPLNEAGSVVELTIPYHERRPVLPGSKLESNRVDIGVFVENAHHLSAPAFVSTNFLDNEKRIYDKEGRLKVLDYLDDRKRDNYVDPRIEPVKNWRDEFAYDEEGNLTGWTRSFEDKEQAPSEFTADGRLVIARNDDGRVTETRPVIYVIQQDASGKERPMVVTAIATRKGAGEDQPGVEKEAAGATLP